MIKCTWLCILPSYHPSVSSLHGWPVHRRPILSRCLYQVYALALASSSSMNCDRNAIEFSNSSKNSSEEQPASSTSASTVALETHSPPAVPRSTSAEPPTSGSAPAAGELHPNGQPATVQLDPATRQYVYKDPDGRKRPVASNGHSPGLENLAFDLHSTNV